MRADDNGNCNDVFFAQFSTTIATIGTHGGRLAAPGIYLMHIQVEGDVQTETVSHSAGGAVLKSTASTVSAIGTLLYVLTGYE